MLPFESTLTNYGAVASILGLGIAIFVLLGFYVGPKFLTSSNTGDRPTLSVGPPASPTSTPTSTPSIFDQPSISSAQTLEEMLKSAQSVRSTSGKSEALRLVAEEAIRRGDYRIAIEAGKSISSTSSKSKTLSYVAICAAKEGLFRIAAEAATEIPSTSVNSSTTVKILEIESKRTSGGGVRDGRPVVEQIAAEGGEGMKRNDRRGCSGTGSGRNIALSLPSLFGTDTRFLEQLGFLEQGLCWMFVAQLVDGMALPILMDAPFSGTVRRSRNRSDSRRDARKLQMLSSVRKG